MVKLAREMETNPTMWCESKGFTIAQLFLQRNSIDTSPGIPKGFRRMGIGKKAVVFAFACLRLYDIPKIYMHKLPANGGLRTNMRLSTESNGCNVFGILWRVKYALGSDYNYTFVPVD